MDIRTKTIGYCCEYLDTSDGEKYNWGCATEEEIISELRKTDVDIDYIASQIKEMPYWDFLKTPYWKGVARIMRLRSKLACQKCGKGGKTSIHHKTYEHHGYEIYYLEDLICLCDRCHTELHNNCKIV